MEIRITKEVEGWAVTTSTTLTMVDTFEDALEEARSLAEGN